MEGELNAAPGILQELHGRALRAVTQAIDEDLEGLTVAARTALRRGRIDKAQRRFLERLDISVHMNMHITQPKARRFSEQLSQRLREPAGAANGAKVVATESSNENEGHGSTRELLDSETLQQSTAKETSKNGAAHEQPRRRLRAQISDASTASGDAGADGRSGSDSDGGDSSHRGNATGRAPAPGVQAELFDIHDILVEASAQTEYGIDYKEPRSITSKPENFTDSTPALLNTIKAIEEEVLELKQELKTARQDHTAAMAAMAEASAIKEKEAGTHITEKDAADKEIAAVLKAMAALEKQMAEAFMQTDADQVFESIETVHGKLDEVTSKQQMLEAGAERAAAELCQAFHEISRLRKVLVAHLPP